MKRFNVARAKKIEGRDKPIWLNVGTITQFDNGNQILELNFLNETFQIFEQKPKEQGEKTENIPF